MNTAAPLKSNATKVHLSFFLFSSNVWIFFPSLLVYSMITYTILFALKFGHSEEVEKMEERTFNEYVCVCVCVIKEIYFLWKELWFFPSFSSEADTFKKCSLHCAPTSKWKWNFVMWNANEEREREREKYERWNRITHSQRIRVSCVIHFRLNTSTHEIGIYSFIYLHFSKWFDDRNWFCQAIEAKWMEWNGMEYA